MNPTPVRSTGCLTAAILASAAALLLYAVTHAWQGPYLLATGVEGIALVLLPFGVGAGVLLLRARLRRGLLTLGLLAMLTLAALLVAGLNPELRAGRLLTGLAALAVLAASLSTGIGLLRMLGLGSEELNDAPRQLVFGLGLGLATLSLAVFLLGMAGALTQLSAMVLLLVMGMIGARPTLRRLGAAWTALHERAEALPWIGWSLLAFASLGVVVLLPTAFTPPLDYDVLEYHIQLPREYVDAGRIHHNPTNAFSGFPQASEMLTLLSFTLAGGYHAQPLAEAWGIWLAKLLAFAFLPLLLLALTSAPSALRGRSDATGTTGGLLAAGVALGTVQTLALAMKLYVELAMSAYTVLALVALARAWHNPERYGRWAALAGLFAGAAAATKYPGLLFGGLAITLLLAAVPVDGVGLIRRLRAAALAGVLCWAVLTPWLVKNTLATGNPIYPLQNHRFGVADWSEAQAERFRKAHRADDFAPAEAVRQAVRIGVGGEGVPVLGRSVTGRMLGLLAFVILPGALLLGRDRRGALALAVWIGGGFVLWFLLTHRIERFFYPMQMLACVLSGLGLVAMIDAAAESRRSRIGVGALSGAALFLAAMVLVIHLWRHLFLTLPKSADGVSRPMLSVLTGVEPVETPLRGWVGTWRLREAMREGVVTGDVMLVGSADPFYLPSNVQYGVVFSQHPFFRILRESETPEEARAALRQRGVGAVYINWLELARLHATYHDAYHLSAEEQARLKSLLSARRMPLSNSWRVAEAAADNAYVRQLVENHAQLFPGGTPAGGYALAPYELYLID